MSRHPRRSRAPRVAFAALIAGVVLGGCGRLQSDATMRVMRVDFETVEEFPPGWVPGGFAQSTVQGDSLRIPAGARAVHAMTSDDYPLALRVQWEPRAVGTGIFIVTRASRDGAGPYGLPRRGVVFAVWDEGRLAFNPYNAGVLWIEGDRLIPIARTRVPVEGPAMLDIYDDGRWALFAVDGEVLCATLTPDFAEAEWSMIPTPGARTAGVMSALLPAPDPEGGDVIIAAPIVLAPREAHIDITELTLLAGAPQKTEEERGRWESLARWDHLRIPRPVRGLVTDAETDEPIRGAMITVNNAEHRHLFTNLEGIFRDSHAPDDMTPPFSMRVVHPDHPALSLDLESADQLSTVEAALARGGAGELSLTLGLDPQSRRLPLAVALVPADGRPPHVHPTPPFQGPLIYRNLGPGTYVAHVVFNDGSEPHTSAPFEVTGEPGQVHTLTLSP